MKRADAICTAYAKEAVPLKNATRYTAVVAYANHNLPLYEAALAKLRALDPPRQDADAARRWLAADRRVAAAVRTLGLAAQRHDFPAVTDAAAKVQQAEVESRRAATALGLQVCGRVG